MDLVIDLLDSECLVKPKLTDAEPAVKFRHSPSEGLHVHGLLQFHGQSNDLIPDSLIKHAAVSVGRMIV